MTDMFNGMFGKIAHGMCRLSMNGGIAVKTSKGYKSYNLEKGKLVNCSNFVFDIGEDFFFVIPTNKVNKGDIILVNGTPRCVIAPPSKEDDVQTIKVVNYENGTAEDILPERHVFMGNTYFYGKIVSMFGDDIMAGGSGTKNIMKYMLISEMFKNGSDSSNQMSSMMSAMPMMAMMGGLGGDTGIFGDIFNFDFNFDNSNDDIEEDEEDEE